MLTQKYHYVIADLVSSIHDHHFSSHFKPGFWQKIFRNQHFWLLLFFFQMNVVSSEWSNFQYFHSECPAEKFSSTYLAKSTSPVSSFWRTRIMRTRSLSRDGNKSTGTKWVSLKNIRLGQQTNFCQVRRLYWLYIFSIITLYWLN